MLYANMEPLKAEEAIAAGTGHLSPQQVYDLHLLATGSEDAADAAWVAHVERRLEAGG